MLIVNVPGTSIGNVGESTLATVNVEALVSSTGIGVDGFVSIIV